MKKSAASAAGSVGGAVSFCRPTPQATPSVSAADAANRSMHDLRDSASEQMSHAFACRRRNGRAYQVVLPRRAGTRAAGHRRLRPRRRRGHRGDGFRSLRTVAGNPRRSQPPSPQGRRIRAFGWRREGQGRRRRRLRRGARRGRPPGPDARRQAPLGLESVDVAKAAGTKAKQAADRAVDKTEQSVDRATVGYKPASPALEAPRGRRSVGLAVFQQSSAFLPDPAFRHRCTFAIR